MTATIIPLRTTARERPLRRAAAAELLVAEGEAAVLDPAGVLLPAGALAGAVGVDAAPPEVEGREKVNGTDRVVEAVGGIEILTGIIFLNSIMKGEGRWTYQRGTDQTGAGERPGYRRRCNAPLNSHEYQLGAGQNCRYMRHQSFEKLDLYS